MTPNIKATRRKQRFTQIANSCLRDKKISWKAKGLMAYFMSHDETWIFRESKIIKDSTDGRESLRTGLKELIKYGYLKKTQVKVNGRYAHIEYYLDDEIEYPPDNDVSTVDGKPVNCKPADGNTPTKNKNNKNNKKKNTLYDLSREKNREEREENKKVREGQQNKSDLLFFIAKLKEALKPEPENNDYPTLGVDGMRYGVNLKGMLYNQDTNEVLQATEAITIYNRCYNHHLQKGK